MRKISIHWNKNDKIQDNVIVLSDHFYFPTKNLHLPNRLYDKAMDLSTDQ